MNAATTTTSSTSSSALEVVSHFLKILDDDKNYQQAADLFLNADTFQMTSPKETFRNVQDWVNRFPKFHKDGPTFEAPAAVATVTGEEGKGEQAGSSSSSLLPPALGEEKKNDDQQQEHHVVALVTRKGMKKFGFINVRLTETYTVDETIGKILGIHVAMAKW